MIYHPDILLGRIKKIHGFEGTVAVKLEKTFTEKITEIKSVFLEIEGKPVPFFISESEYKGGDTIKIRFEGYNTFEKVHEFTGCQVFLDAVGYKAEPTGNLIKIKGFKVKMHNHRLAGVVTGVIESPGQWLIKVETEKGKELLIPFHEDLIIKIDKKSKVIHMDLPAGLTEIN